MNIITSRQNAKLKNILSLSRKKSRDSEGLFIADGRKLYLEAVETGMEITDVLCSESYASQYEDVADNCLTVVSDSIFEQISGESAPQGIITVIKKPSKLHTVCDLYNGVERNIIVCHGVQDPGNLGTIIRTAYAMLTDAVILIGDCADIYNPKTVRATMGGIFRQKIYICRDCLGTLENIKQNHRLLATALNRSASPLGSFELENNDCFVMGNEGHGLPQEIIDICDKTVFIPMRNGAESLNVSQAANIVMWEKMKTLNNGR